MKRLLTSAAMFLCSLLTFAQFSGSGSGTENDPYLILNPIQLNQMRNFLGKKVYFKLMADIDLTEFLEDENPSQGWQPVGTSSAPFKGVLDGNGKTISYLWINRPTTNYVGCFGYTEGSTIKDLFLVDVSISGHDCVGGLCGYSSGTVSNCTINGNVEGNSKVGGFWGSGSVNLSMSSSYIDVKGTGDYIGGFAGYSNDCSISNCALNSKLVKGNNYVGGISGYHYSGGALDNNTVYSQVTGVDYVGGLYGCLQPNNDYPYTSTSIKRSFFFGNVYGKSNVGGICGKYFGIKSKGLEQCSVNGNITSQSDYVGGLVGYFSSTDGGQLKDSFFTGIVKGNNYVGGIVGYNSIGDIISNYMNASVSGTENVGGICGIMAYHRDRRSKLYSNIVISTYVKATKGNVGRIYGSYSNNNIGVIGTANENKAWNRTIVISQGIAQDVIDDLQNGTGIGATTLKLKATYVAMGWNFTDTWEIQETESYPYFKTQTAPPVITSNVVSGATTISGKCIDGGTVTLETDGVKQQMVSTGNEFLFTVSPLQAGHEVRISAKAEGKEQSYYTTEIVSYLGKGTEADPYQVYTASDLIGVYRKGYFKLMNDVDLTSYINQFSPTEGWQSIGREGSETIHFDGNGHIITGLWCNSTRDNTGLFSCFANGSIKNLIVETDKGKQVKGGANTGILIGKMINGTIENCRVSGTVVDGTPVGGMVGLFDGGKISLSQADVTINTAGGKSYVGGLVGEVTGGEIDQCVTLGNITATGKESYVGGLVGKNYATITNCYSTVNITSSYNAAGIVAYNYSMVDKCLYTGNLFSNNYAAGIIGYNDGENAVVQNCVATSNKIDVTYESQSAQSGGYGQRIIGGIKNGAPAPELNNYALKNMQVSLNNVSQKVYDDIMNGVGKNGSDLAKASTYQELGWNFSTIWTIVEGESYPSLKNNAAFVLQPGEDPVEVDLTAPTAKSGLVYNGSAQELITAGNTNVGTLKYSLDGSNYDTDIPKGTDAKTYTVYYRVVDSENKDLTTAASLIVTISPKIVSSPTITLSETSFVYDGEEKKPTVTVKDGDTTIPASEYTVSYNNNVNVGTATVTINDQDGGNYVVSGSAQFIIISATANVTAPQARSGLVYNGSAQELITAGSSTAGEMQYSLDGSNYSTAIPRGMDAKTYTVYYRVKGDANHNDIAPATLAATISPKTVSSPIITLSETLFVYDGEEKEPTVTVKDGNTTIPASEYTVSYNNNVNVGTATVIISDQDGGNYVVSGSAQFSIISATANVTAPQARSGLVYNGSDQDLITAGSSTAGEMQYSLDGSNYSTAIPKGTDAKTYTVYYRVKGDANHSDIAPATLTATISPKTVSSPTITLSETSFVYDGEEKRPTVTVKDGDTTIPASEYTVSYYNNVNVGTATVTINDQDGGNYVVSGTSTFEIKEAAMSILAPNVISGLIYTGYAQELITPGYTSVGKMLYSLDDINYFTVVPAEKEAKTYTVYYKVTDETETIDLSASASLTVAISKAPLKISVGDYTMTEGDQIPEFELQYDGFKNYETEEVLTKMPSVSCNATANSAPGRYEIIVSGAEAQNYDISYQSGWLTIEIAQGIADIVTDDQPFDVYNTQGRKVRFGVTSLKGLPKGVYIINGKKVMK